MSLAGAAISLSAAILSAVFTIIVLQQFLERRKARSLLWSIGLGMFTLVAVAQLIAETGGWTDGLFKAWYVLGTSLVGFLGGGSVYLLNKKAGHAFTAYLVALFLAFVAMAMTTPTDPAVLAAYTAGEPPSGTAWAAGAAVRRMSPLFTIPGSVTLIGIALYGLVRYRIEYTAWIAAGAVVLAVGTGLARIGIASVIYAAEFAGIALMFVGFWKAAEWAKERAKTTPVLPPEQETTEAPSPTVQTAPK